MELPSLTVLRPRVNATELRLRTLGHGAFDAAELREAMNRIALAGPQVTVAEAFALLGVDPDQGWDLMKTAAELRWFTLNMN